MLWEPDAVHCRQGTTRGPGFPSRPASAEPPDPGPLRRHDWSMYGNQPYHRKDEDRRRSPERDPRRLRAAHRHPAGLCRRGQPRSPARGRPSRNRAGCRHPRGDFRHRGDPRPLFDLRDLADRRPDRRRPRPRGAGCRTEHRGELSAHQRHRLGIGLSRHRQRQPPERPDRRHRPHLGRLPARRREHAAQRQHPSRRVPVHHGGRNGNRAHSGGAPRMLRPWHHR